jgi:starch-binding outer membrane protein, SusD/RagB family
MKSILKQYFIFILLLFIIGACNDEFLERYPLDSLSSETFWKTESDLMNYNNRFYGMLSANHAHRDIPILMGCIDNQWTGGFWYGALFGDDFGPTHNRAEPWYEVRTGKHQITDEPRYKGYRGWDFVRALNFGIVNYGKGGLPESVTSKYEAEARLMRAIFYAEKVMKFGDVQWADKPLNIDDEEILYGPRHEREFVMEKVLEDFDYAIANLPADWGLGENPGRVTKWVALAYKSRKCLYEGTWRKYHGLGNSDLWLQESANAAKKLMDDGPFEIDNRTGNPLTAYRFMHYQTTQEGNPEVIYWRKAEHPFMGHGDSRLWFNYNGGATKSFVEDVLCTDGLPITLSELYAGDDEFESVFINRDPRLRQCVLNPDDRILEANPEQGLFIYPANDQRAYPILPGQSGGGRNRANTGYHVVKHYNDIDEMVPRGQQQVSPPTIRLGEVLLNYAEAKAELGTITQTDLDISINKLRDRVAMAHLTLDPPMDPRYADMGVSALIVEIRRERRVELFIEGQGRYFDILRWKQGPRFLGTPTLGMLFDATAETRYPGASAQVKTTMVDGKPYIDVYKGTDFDNAVFDESKHYRWPIPIEALSQNPNLGQNPGW